MPKDGEIEYLRSLGEAGRQHAANKPFSDAQCHIFLEDIGAILALLPPPPGRLLDLGCGTGWTSNFFARRGYDVVGVDIAADMIAIANELRDQAGLRNLTFVESDYETLDFREAFERWLGNGKQAFIAKDRLSLADAIGLIHRAGGLAVLAHPGGLGTRERLAALAAFGLDGVEVLHPSHSGDDSQRLDALAGELKLVRSGGSDWHGTPESARSLGMMRVPSQWLVDQEARVAARGSRRVA